MGSDQHHKKVGGQRRSRKHDQGLVNPEDDLSEDSTLLETVAVEKGVKRVSVRENIASPSAQQSQRTKKSESSGREPLDNQKLPRRRDVDKEKTNGTKPRCNRREDQKNTQPDGDSGTKSSRRSRSVDACKTAYRISSGGNQDSSSATHSMPVNSREMREERQRGRARRSTSVDAGRHCNASNIPNNEELAARSSLHSRRRSGSSSRDIPASERRRKDQEGSRRSRSASRDRSRRKGLIGSNHEPRRRLKAQSMPSPQPGASNSVVPSDASNQFNNIMENIRSPLQGGQVEEAVSLQTPKGRSKPRPRSGERIHRRLSGDTNLHTQGAAPSPAAGAASRRMPKGSGHSSGGMASPFPSRKRAIPAVLSPNPALILPSRPRSVERPNSQQIRMNCSGTEAVRPPPLAGNRRTAILLEYQSKSQGDIVSRKAMSHELRKVISDRLLAARSPQITAGDSPAVRRRKERRASLASSFDLPSVSSAPTVGGVDFDTPISWQALVDAKTNGAFKNKFSSNQQSLKSPTVHGGEADAGWDEWGWPKSHHTGATVSMDAWRDTENERRHTSSRKLMSTTNVFQSSSSHSPFHAR